MRVRWIECVNRTTGADVVARWLITGTVNTASCVCACAQARGLQLRCPEGYSIASDAVAVTRLDDETLTLQFHVVTANVELGKSIRGQVWDVLRGLVVAGGVRVTAAAPSPHEGVSVNAGAADMPSHELASVVCMEPSSGSTGAGDAAVCTRSSHGAAASCQQDKLIACIPGKVMRAWFRALFDAPAGTVKYIRLGNATSTPTVHTLVSDDDVAMLPANIRDCAIYIDMCSGVGMLDHETEVAAVCGTVSTLPTRFEMLNMVYAALDMDVMDDVEWQTRQQCCTTSTLKLILDAGDKLLDNSLSAITPTTHDERTSALIAKRAGTHQRMFVIRTRAYATQRVQYKCPGYDIHALVPHQMTVRFLTIHTPGVWELHLSTRDTPVICRAGVTIDLAPYACAGDFSTFTHFMPDRHGISFAEHHPLVQRHEDVKGPLPPQIQISVAGTTLVLLWDDVAYPMAGFMYCQQYKSSIDDLVNANWEMYRA